MKKILEKSYLIITAIFFLPLIVRAQDVSADIPNVNLGDIAAKIAQYFLGFVVLATIFMIIWAGFNLVTAEGDQEKVIKAKKTILGAVVGLIIALLAQIIVNVALDAVGAGVNVNLNN